jgi:phage protein D/phage baseplate assembly protein gpV
MVDLLSPVVKLSGSAINVADLGNLLEIRVDRAFGVPGELMLRFLDDGYEMSSANHFNLADEVTVLDKPNDGTALIVAEVTSIAVEQRQGEQPELVVTAHDKSHRLGRNSKVAVYTQMTSSDIVSQLVSDAGLTPSVTATSDTQPVVMQADTNLGMINALAQRVGYDWWVEGSTFNFKPPTAGGATVSLTLGTDLLSFSVRAHGHGLSGVDVEGWDRTRQEKVGNQATSATVPLSSSTLAAMVTPAKVSDAFGSAPMFTTSLGAQSQAEATALSQSLLDRSAASAVSARGEMLGSALVALGATVELADAGPLSGTYPVTRVVHTYRSGGFITKFWSGDRRPNSLVDTLGAPGGLSASSLLMPGLRVGTVTNINDPDNAGKVKVLFPGVDTTMESGWARVLAVGGGATRGNVFIPEVNDEVLVGFEGNDLRQPVVLGGLYGAKSTTPPTGVEDGKVNTRGMTSRLGHTLMFLDGTDPATQAIELKLAGGEHLIHLGKDEVDVKVPSGLALNIVAGSTSIKIGTDGSIAMSASTISLKAEQSISLQAPQIQASADAQLTLKASGSVQVSGGEIQVSSQGPAQIGGNPVMIN